MENGPCRHPQMSPCPRPDRSELFWWRERADRKGRVHFPTAGGDMLIIHCVEYMLDALAHHDKQIGPPFKVNWHFNLELISLVPLRSKPNRTIKRGSAPNAIWERWNKKVSWHKTAVQASRVRKGSPIVVITVPAKKKEELMSHRLVWLKEFPEGFTPALTADTTCCRDGGKSTDQKNDQCASNWRGSDRLRGSMSGSAPAKRWANFFRIYDPFSGIFWTGGENELSLTCLSR